MAEQVLGYIPDLYFLPTLCQEFSKRMILAEPLVPPLAVISTNNVCLLWLGKLPLSLILTLGVGAFLGEED